MNEQAKSEIREDFLAWSGGFPPESDEQITVYVDYARPGDSDEDEVRELLRRWMQELDLRDLSRN